MRIHRVSDEQWKRLVAARREHADPVPPVRASIGAIETELSVLRGRRQRREQSPAPQR